MLSAAMLMSMAKPVAISPCIGACILSYVLDIASPLNWLEGRITLSYQGYEKHVALIQHGASIGDAKLWYDQHKKRFYLLVSLELEVADPTFESHKDVVGVDVGIRYLAVTSTSTGEPTFHEGKRVRHQAKGETP